MFSILFLIFQLKRLRSDVQVVRGNLTIMADMMTQMHPGCAQLSDKELLQVRPPFRQASPDQIIYIYNLHTFYTKRCVLSPYV